MLLFVVLSAVVGWGQHSGATPLIGNDCEAILSSSGPYRCPNKASCGSYHTIQTENCNEDNAEQCALLQSFATCCNTYFEYLPVDGCLFAEMRSTGVRSKLLELAREREILVPNCTGAYVPASTVFQELRSGGKDHGGL